MKPVPQLRSEVRDPEAMLARMVPVVAAWCSRLGGGTIDDDAAASDALMILLRRLPDLRPDSPIEPFAWAITVRTVQKHRRRAWWRRWVPAALAEPATGDQSDARERAALVHRVLDALSEAHRQIIVLMDLEERSASEVAAMMDVPEGTVRSRLRLARVAFRTEADRIGLGVLFLVEDPHDA